MPNKVTFGPQGSQWVYDRQTKTYDLTRESSSSSSPSLKVALTNGPPDTSILLSPARTVLVIVDMQNFFLHPSCRTHPAGLATVPPLLSVIAHCRTVGVQVVWLNWGLTDDDLEEMPAGILRGFAATSIVASDDDDDDNESEEEEKKKKKKKNRKEKNTKKVGLGVDLGEGRGRTLCAGAWNSALYEPLAQVVAEGDVYCAKNRMSGLWREDQPLWRYLDGKWAEEEEEEEKEKKKKTTLLFAGVNTDQCVLGTLTDAYNAGWDCVMIEDCCATTTPGAPEVCAYNIGKNYGFVIDSKTFISAAAAAAAAAAAVAVESG